MLLKIISNQHRWAMEVATMTNTIQVFVPVGVVSTAALNSSARQADRSAFIVGMLDNHKHGTTQILDRLQERLSAQFTGVQFVRYKKADAGKSAGSKIIEALAKDCGVVLNGVAD